MRHPVAISTLLLFSTAFILSAGPFVNGSFETNSGAVGCNPTLGNYATLGVGSTCITGWSIAGANIDYINGFWPAPDGTHSLDMTGNQGAGSIVQQTFDTISGLQYFVTFSMAGNPGGNPGSTIKSLHVTGASNSQDYTFNSAGHTIASLASMGWVTETFTFIAVAPLTTLSFTSTTNDPANGAALDAVSITASPEPGSTGLLAAGVVLMILGRRSLRRRLV